MFSTKRRTLHNSKLQPRVLRLDILHKKWQCVKQSKGPTLLKSSILVQFLQDFVDQFEQIQSHLVSARFEDTREVLILLVHHLFERLHQLTSGGNHKHQADNLFEYFSGFSYSGEGLYLIWVIEIITREESYSVITPAGLSSVITSVLLQILGIPKEALTYRKGQASCPHIPSFCSYSFVSIPNLFKIPPIPFFLLNFISTKERNDTISPPVISTILPHSTTMHSVSSSSPPKRRSHTLATKIPPNSVSASVCFHLLSILGNLLTHEDCLKELAERGLLIPLMNVMCVDSTSFSCASEFGLFTIRRQLVRTISSTLITACRTLDTLELLTKENIITHLLYVMKNAKELETTTCLELTQAIVMALTKSAQISSCFYDEFSLQAGYRTLTSNLVYVGENGSTYERNAFIGIVCTLMCNSAYSSRRTTTLGGDTRKDQIENLESFAVLLQALRQCSSEEMKGELLNAIHAIMLLDDSAGYSILQSFAPFEIIFGEFKDFSLSNKRTVLCMMDDVLNNGTLLDEELGAYCGLLERIPEHMCGTLLVAQHLFHLVSSNRISHHHLRSTKLFSYLIEYLFVPNVSTCIDHWSEAIKRDIIAACEVTGLSQIHEDESIFMQDTTRSNIITRLEYKLVLQVLEIMIELLSNDIKNQIIFREKGGLKKLYSLLMDDRLREVVLKVLGIASAHSKQCGGIVQDIINVLQLSGGTHTIKMQTLQMRYDILKALSNMLYLNPMLKDEFRDSGGFIWAVMVINGIGQSLDSKGKEKTSETIPPTSSEQQQPQDYKEKEKKKKEYFTIMALEHSDVLPDVFSFLLILLRVISIAMTGNVLNQRYFRKDIKFVTLADALYSCSWCIGGSYTVMVADALLDMAVEGSWPGGCPRHATTTTIHTIEQTAKKCVGCQAQLRIENPEVLGIICRLLGSALNRTNDTHVTCVVKRMAFLTLITGSNLQLVAESGILRHLLVHLRSVLVPYIVSSHKRVVINENENEKEEDVSKMYNFVKLKEILIVEDTKTSTEDIPTSMENILTSSSMNNDIEARRKLRKTVLRLIAHLARHHITATELRLLLQLLDVSSNMNGNVHQKKEMHIKEKYIHESNNEVQLHVLSTLEISARRPYPVPTYFVDMKGRKAGIKLSGLEASPFLLPSRYTLSIWINVLCFASMPKVSVFRMGELGVSLQGRHIVVRHSFKNYVVFPDFRVEEGRWYHVVVSKSIDVGSGMGKSSSTTRSGPVLRLFVDGISRGTIHLTSHDRSSSTSTSTSSHRRDTRPVIGSYSPTTTTNTNINTNTTTAGPISLRRIKRRSRSKDKDSNTSVVPKSKGRDGTVRSRSNRIPTTSPSSSSSSSSTTGGCKEHPSGGTFGGEVHWQVGNVHFFEETITTTEALLLHMIGPDYCGNLLPDIGNFHVYDMVNEDLLKHASLEDINLLLRPAGTTMSYLSASIMFVFCARNIMAGQRDRTEGSGSSSGGGGLRSGPANGGSGGATGARTASKLRLSVFPCSISGSQGSTQTHKRASIHDVLHNVGGIANILWYMANLPPGINSGSTAGEVEEEHMGSLLHVNSVRLLHNLLAYNARNVREMINTCGYRLLARIVKKRMWRRDDNLLQAFFQFAGVHIEIDYEQEEIIQYHQRESSFPLSSSQQDNPIQHENTNILPTHNTHTIHKHPDKQQQHQLEGETNNTFIRVWGVINNRRALAHLLLDWGVWREASVDTQRHLLLVLLHLVQSHEEAAFNADQFRAAGVTSRLLNVLRSFHNEDSGESEEEGYLNTEETKEKRVMKEKSTLVPLMVRIIRAVTLSSSTSAVGEENEHHGYPTHHLQDFKGLVQFLVETHTSPRVLTRTTTSSPSSSSMHEHLSRSSSLPSIIASSTSGDSSQSFRRKSSPSVCVFPSPSSSSLVHKHEPVNDIHPLLSAIERARLCVLELLHEMVSGVKDEGRNAEDLLEVMPLDTIFGLMGVESCEVRVQVLCVLAECLRNPRVNAQFNKTKGFHVLGDVLGRKRGKQRDVIGVLLCLLLGRSPRQYLRSQSARVKLNYSYKTPYTVSATKVPMKGERKGRKKVEEGGGGKGRKEKGKEGGIRDAVGLHRSLHRRWNSSSSSPFSSSTTKKKNKGKEIREYYSKEKKGDKHYKGNNKKKEHMQNTSTTPHPLERSRRGKDQEEIQDSSSLSSYSSSSSSSSSSHSQRSDLAMYYFFFGELSGEVRMREGGAVVSILRVLKSGDISHRLTHFTLKILWNIFLQGDDVKDTLIRHELVIHLTALLPKEWTRAVRTTNPLHQYEEDVGRWDVVEDLLNLLKAIALHACISMTGKEGLALIDTILMGVGSAKGLSPGVSAGLQMRILKDQLHFFAENDITKNLAVVHTFQSVCILAIKTFTCLYNPENEALISKRRYKEEEKKEKEKKKEKEEKREEEKNGIQCSVVTTSRVKEGSTSRINDREDSNMNNSTEDDGHQHLASSEQFLGALVLAIEHTRDRLPVDSPIYSRLFSPTSELQKSWRGVMLHVLRVERGEGALSMEVLRVMGKVVPLVVSIRPFITCFLAYTSHLLSAKEEGVRAANGHVWRLILTSNMPWLSDVFFMDSVTHATLCTPVEAGQEHSFDHVIMEDISSPVHAHEEKQRNREMTWIKDREGCINDIHLAESKERDIISKSITQVTDHMMRLMMDSIQKTLGEKLRRKQVVQRLIQQWKALTRRVGHVRSVWPAPCLSTRWKLDPTEGALRIRPRLKPELWKEEKEEEEEEEKEEKENKEKNKIKNEKEEEEEEEEEEKGINLVTAETVIRRYKRVTPGVVTLFGESGGSKDLYSLVDALKPGERILHIVKCHCITPFTTREGEMLISQKKAYFFDHKVYSTLSQTTSTHDTINSKSTSHSSVKETKIEETGSGLDIPKSRTNEYHEYQEQMEQKRKANKAGWMGVKSITWIYEEIREVHKRRYLLEDTGMEIFLTTGRTYLLAFDSTTDRDTAYSRLLSMDLVNRVDYESEVSGNLLRLSITGKWARGRLSNYEYLMHLNTLAGRSFNDLTQYPVFPWVLKDYSSPTLRLDNPDSFRDFSKPMGAQDDKRLAKFKEKYSMLVEMGETPYLYGSHYSNMGSVLHYLVRLEPFSHGFIEFQGGRFDVPDRSFHSLGQSWALSSSLSSSDVKELIPEFFSLPEFLTNDNKFDMGVRQSDRCRVGDVILPPWANGDPRLFVKKHREALESRYVSEHLHLWIDLMFGASQQGKKALQALNIFHPLTYEGAVNIDEIEDDVIRKATIAQISSYGQTPKQLFKKSHVQRIWKEPERTIHSHPHNLWAYPLWKGEFHVGAIAIVNDQPIPLKPNQTLLFPDPSKVISWGHWDQTLLIQSTDTGRVISALDTLHDDDIMSTHITSNGKYFVTGGTAGVVKVWRKDNTKKSIRIRLKAELTGHYSTILCVKTSVEWNVVVSGSSDKTAIVWDLNRLRFIRCLHIHEGPVSSTAISPTTGNIFTATGAPSSSLSISTPPSPPYPVSFPYSASPRKSGLSYESTLPSSLPHYHHHNDNNNGSGGGGSRRELDEEWRKAGPSRIYLWSINGKLLASNWCEGEERVTVMQVTGGTEGTARNTLITGLHNGDIKIWDAYDLTPLQRLKGHTSSPVLALAISSSFTEMYTADAKGTSICWSSRKMSNPTQLMRNIKQHSAVSEDLNTTHNQRTERELLALMELQNNLEDHTSTTENPMSIPTPDTSH